MTPQSNFMIAAPVLPEREDSLRALLATMNLRPGVADPDNALFPFGQFERLHFARFVILEDDTLDDLARYGESFPDAPVWLAFLGDCDGPAERALEAFAARAGAGLQQVFRHCAGFSPESDLLRWMQAHAVLPAAQYVNWVGRTVRQAREEAALHVELRACLERDSAQLLNQPATAIREHLISFVRRNGPMLTKPARTPLGWRLRHLLRLIGVPLVLLLLTPFLVLYAPFFVWELRRREATDPVITPRPNPAHVSALTAIEDHDVSNQFSAIGSVKPGWFRLSTLIFLFWVLDFTTQCIYTRGRLARVGTIHFARWVFLDNRRRLLFASSYDGSLDSYMDDFINKVAFGLNLVFSNGVGYPRTKFLILGGAKDELAFKNFIRRHEVPSQVWYNAHPGLTAANLITNSEIRAGFERRTMTEAEARQWLALL